MASSNPTASLSSVVTSSLFVQEGVDQVVQIVESMHKNFRNHFKEKMEKYDEIHKKIKGLNDDKQRLEIVKSFELIFDFVKM